MNTTVSLQRIGWLSKKEFFQSFLPFFRIMGIVFGAFLIVSALVAYFNPNETFDVSINIAIFIFGFVYVANSFSELKKLPTRADFLILPASAGEKVFTKWLFTHVLYWIGACILFLVYYLLSEFIIGWILQRPIPDMHMSLSENLRGLHFATIIFSIFFFAAATFNNGGWFKLLAWAIGGFLTYMALVAAFAYLLFPELRMDGETINFDGNFPLDLMMEDFWLVRLGKFFISYLAAPFFWFMSYLKIKEKEV
ncbi:MAG: hypothetical protein IT266_06570 [Saprospiraceae bacterium]|nr:hypothetical protein [Saprospiraceae bacterium]